MVRSSRGDMPESAPSVALIVSGNAVDDGAVAGRRGWFIGHFVAPAASPAATDDVEVKWGTHKAGEIKRTVGVNRTATTMSILVSGRFRLDFPDHDRSVMFERPGDYAVWPPGVPHRWEVIEDAVILTVRWPSRPDDQHAPADPSFPLGG